MNHRDALESLPGYQLTWRQIKVFLWLLWLGGLTGIVMFTRTLPGLLNPTDFSPERHELLDSREEEVYRRTAPHTEESDLVEVPTVWRDPKSGQVYRESSKLARIRAVVGICQSCVLILFLVLATLVTDRFFAIAQRARNESRDPADSSTFVLSGWLIAGCVISLLRDVWGYFSP